MRSVAFLTGLLATAGPFLVGAELQPSSAVSLTAAAAAITTAPTTTTTTTTSRTLPRGRKTIRTARRKYFVPPELPTSSPLAAATDSGSSAKPTASATAVGHRLLAHHERDDEDSLAPSTNTITVTATATAAAAAAAEAAQTSSVLFKCPRRKSGPKKPRLPEQPKPTTTTTTATSVSSTSSPSTTSTSTTSPGARTVTVTVTITPSPRCCTDTDAATTAPAYTPTYILDPRPTDDAALPAFEARGARDSPVIADTLTERLKKTIADAVKHDEPIQNLDPFDPKGVVDGKLKKHRKPKAAAKQH
ncbi:hypothetical protein LY78DRAFT_672195 [Colletotrichum sublineola]|nr:hypothetical protein LY78DRAFT_672195 [Colletotrichum sublineola]